MPSYTSYVYLSTRAVLPVEVHLLRLFRRAGKVRRARAYVDAVCREIDARLAGKALLTPIQTLYIGGGTPSLLKASDYTRIFEAFKRHTRFADGAEITLEVNPKAMADTAADYVKAGFNRVSVGVQSFDDMELKALSRAHTGQDAKDCVAALQAGGFKNISIDLMYGIPQQTQVSWAQTLAQAGDLGVQHVSMYGLKVEEGTALERLLDFDRYQLPGDDATVDMYFQALRTLEKSGFERYEFSNLAQDGFASRHNLNYWDNAPFWAFGVAAHGYIDDVRYETVRDLAGYLENPLAGETHTVSKEEALENALIFGLRKADGVDISALERAYNVDFNEKYRALLVKYSDFLVREGDRLFLTEAAIPVSNAILGEFLS